MYKAFIEEAARLYADTLVYPMTDISKVVWLWTNERTEQFLQEHLNALPEVAASGE